jgi:hypothetical protein
MEPDHYWLLHHGPNFISLVNKEPSPDIIEDEGTGTMTTEDSEESLLFSKMRWKHQVIYIYVYIADGSAEIDFCSVWQKHSETGFWTMWSGILSKKDSRVSLNLILPIIRTRQAIIHPGRHDCVYFGWKEFCENDDIDSTSMMGMEEFQFRWSVQWFLHTDLHADAPPETAVSQSESGNH